MKIFKSFKILNKEIKLNKSIGFVPTMGSLHSGHLSLIKDAKKKCKKVVVSIFINPSQFNDRKDFNRYPRNFNKDIKILKKLKVNFLFLPNENEIYRSGIKKKINISKKDRVLCAKKRKGHFEGVLAVIARFLQNIDVNYLYLGEKDFQQVFLINKYLKNKYKIKIISCKTVRNKYKLPLSSRNKLLTKNLLKKSEAISSLLFKFKKEISINFNNIKMMNFYKSKIKNLCTKIEYFEIRNLNNLSKRFSMNNYKIFIAYRQKNIRLIDNI